MEVVASLSQGRTAAAQCGLFTHKSVPFIFGPPCTESTVHIFSTLFVALSCEGKKIVICCEVELVKTSEHGENNDGVL